MRRVCCNFVQQGSGGRPVSPRCQKEVALTHVIESGKGMWQGVGNEAT